jgi:hypothetical protein
MEMSVKNFSAGGSCVRRLPWLQGVLNFITADFSTCLMCRHYCSVEIAVIPGQIPSTSDSKKKNLLTFLISTWNDACCKTYY